MLLARHITIALAFSVLLLDNARAVRADAFATSIQPILQKYCVRCHGGGEEINGEVDFTKIKSQAKVEEHFELWETAVELVAAGSMPPEDQPQPSDEEKAILRDWYHDRFVRNVQPHPSYFRPRRLSAYEYRNTLHSLFGFELEVAVREAEQTVVEKSLVMKLLPTDPPGPTGFTNDTSGNPLTTVIWDQYSYLTDNALARLFSPKYRHALESFVGKIDGERLTSEQAAQLIRTIARHAYRRPVDDDVLTKSFAAIEGKSGDDLEKALRTELKTILMSPPFIYRGLLIDVPRDIQHAVDEFELSERLSYFLWGDMPDDELMELATNSRLSEADVYRKQIDRMLASPKSRSLAEDFAAQWLTLNEISKTSKNPPQAEAFRSQPLDFMHYLIVENRPLIELIDSRTTFANPFTAGFYGKDRGQMKRYRKPKGIEVEIVPNQKISLVNTKERGGILTIPGVLAMNRGPVIRGTWILERILGEHLPEPPPDVGQIPVNKRGQKLSFRERFEMHRSKPTCAICHDKIDPLGFALQRYEGPNYKSDSKSDTSGQLPSGEKFEDFAGLKQILVTSQRERVIRNIVRRTMAYALCRKLTIYDRPTVESMVKELNENDGTFHDLIHQVANSLPFKETVLKSK